MKISYQEHSGGHVYRLDRFVVPSQARDEFLSRVRATHAILREQKGFVRDFLLEQPADEDATSIVTMVEWDSQETVDRVVAVVQAAHRAIGFDPKVTMVRLAIKAEIGVYRAIENSNAATA